MDSSSPIQIQLSAVHNNIDIGRYPNSAKAVKGWGISFGV